MDEPKPPITLTQLSSMTIDQAQHLPVADVFLLVEELSRLKQNVKGIDHMMQCLLAEKFGAEATAARSAVDKDTGTVRWPVDNGLTVVADLPKKVDWDQKLLAQAVAELAATGEPIDDYVTTEYSVPESKYTAWPSSLQSIFARARTVGTGKPTFKIEKAKHA